MNLGRRNFLLITATAISTPYCGLLPRAQNNQRNGVSHQGQGKGVSPPEPAQPFPVILEKNVPGNWKRPSQEEREKEFRDSLQQLSDCIVKLQHDLNGLDSRDFFAVQIYKEAEAIEHCAKKLKRLARPE